MKMRVLELYSGIGGMHYALKESHVEAEIVAAIDINNVANSVYKHNFPQINLLNRNIQSLTSKFINGLNVDILLMSPPCQPFTRNGLQGDITDNRTCSFTHLLKILPELTLKSILIENVKGFEVSKMREVLINALKDANFVFQEYILSPSQFGLCNTRHRYYCLAKKSTNLPNCDNTVKYELEQISFDITQKTRIADIIESNIDEETFLVPDKILKKRVMLLDICYKDSSRSCCFTKAYGRYVEGTGSVFTAQLKQEVDLAFEKLKMIEQNSEEYLQVLNKLKLRFFTPKEVGRLMNFPSNFTFPDTTTNLQKYRLLGNSINVKVVSELIKLLLI